MVLLDQAPVTEKAVLVGVVLPGQDVGEVEENLDELHSLTTSAGGRPAARLIQERSAVDPATFIGRGKADELRDLVERYDAQLVIFDDDLRPSQAKKLGELLEVRVLDRTGLILDIFARRAATREAKIQVELAQLQYLLPRLAGLWGHLERQRGGIGLRGVGEKQIEIDRRLARNRIARLRRELSRITTQRRTRRKRRQGIRRVALVGYTNAGKSTLFNRMTRSEVRCHDQLFVTLDTTVRTLKGAGRRILVSDTVGFIRKLPHLLVESFRGTLEEAVEADLLLQVVDASHPRWREHIDWSEGVLEELGIADKQCITVFNKIDRLDGDGRLRERFGEDRPLSVAVSAATGDHVDRLGRMIVHILDNRGDIGRGTSGLPAEVTGG